MCVEKYILGISLIHKVKLKRTLVKYPVKIFIRGKKRRPIRLNNKGGKYLISSSLGVGPLY